MTDTSITRHQVLGRPRLALTGNEEAPASPARRRSVRPAFILAATAVGIVLAGSANAEPNSPIGLVTLVVGIVLALIAVISLGFTRRPRTATTSQALTPALDAGRISRELQILIDQYGEQDPGLDAEARTMLAGIRAGDPMVTHVADRRLPRLRRKAIGQ